LSLVHNLLSCLLSFITRNLSEFPVFTNLYPSLVDQPPQLVRSFQANKNVATFQPCCKLCSGEKGTEHHVAIFQPRFTPMNQRPCGIMKLFTLKANRRQRDLKILLFIQKERILYSRPCPLVT